MTVGLGRNKTHQLTKKNNINIYINWFTVNTVIISISSNDIHIWLAGQIVKKNSNANSELNTVETDFSFLIMF